MRIHVVVKVPLYTVFLLAEQTLKLVSVGRLEVLVPRDSCLEHVTAFEARKCLLGLIVNFHEMHLQPLPTSKAFDAQCACHRLASLADELMLLKFVLRLEHFLTFNADYLVNVLCSVSLDPAAGLKVLAARLTDVPCEMRARMYVQYRQAGEFLFASDAHVAILLQSHWNKTSDLCL